MATTAKTPTAPKQIPWYEGRLWGGCNLGGWLRMLAHNRFRVDWRHWSMAASITTFSACNSLLGGVQRLAVGRRPDRLELEEPPLFVIGHWRSGTTLMHELLALDPRHIYPTTYECFAPNHFLISEPYAGWIKFLLPRERPMDSMKMSWDRPQEDESGLCNLGLPSPFWTVAFPNEPPQFPEYVTLDELAAEDRRAWQQALLGLLKRISYKHGGHGRLVLKSPQHTFRLRVLKELFPEARFVHLCRDPYVLFPSTVHFWKSMYLAHGLQTPTFAGLDELVLSTLEQMHAQLEATRELIEPRRFCEVRYEHLVADPVGELRRVYDHLQLGSFEHLEPHLDRYRRDTATYQTNTYAQLDPAIRATIARRWRPYFDRYGYAVD
ncbi:MAG: sulfotransferase [Pirellulales bacterium]|nr:sulfotransferase [Pirellulales bacterium]